MTTHNTSVIAVSLEANTIQPPSVTVTFVNRGDEDALVPKYLVEPGPESGAQSLWLLGANPPAYRGKLVKRSEPTSEDCIRLTSGSSYTSAEVSLSELFDGDLSGRQLEYRAFAQVPGEKELVPLVSNPVTL